MTYTATAAGVVRRIPEAAARLLAHIREDIARADALLVQLRDGGMSWGDLAALIDPDNPPARSSAQRRVEFARRRLNACWPGRLSLTLKLL
ncbi:hypothetical protein [Streptomyces sp. NBC_00057]|uniref:hypothetical protein n=1 Tax=Streptomyces sp. NBC_00057 TaxID=2975634 RepID=UPI0032454585